MTHTPKIPHTRIQTLKRMLTLLPDIQTTLRTGGSGDQTHATLRLHDPNCRLHTRGLRCTCWVQSFDELERCLKLMHKLGHQQAVHYQHKPGDQRTCSLHTAWWHVRHWYVDVEWRSRPTVRYAAVKGGGKTRITDPNHPIRTPIRHPDARETKAHAGVTWIATEFQGEPRVAPEMAEAA